MLFERFINVFIIAEISSNHCQDFNRAIELIKQAKLSGADAVKFQTYTPDTMTLDSKESIFMIDHPRWGNQSLYDLYSKANTPWEWFKDLKRISDDLGILFFSTSFDKKSVDLLEEINVPCHKIASFELTDLPLIEYVSKTKKPLILSTGMASLSEIQEAVDIARNNVKELVLLKCSSSYPAEPSEMNINTISHMKQLFNCDVGFSDHSLNIGASIAAVSAGASVIEKHFTLSRQIDSPDNFFSLEPNEFRLLVDNIRIAEQSFGDIKYDTTSGEEKSRIFRRSIFVVKDIKKGETFTEDNIKIIRPEVGLKPKYFSEILNKSAACYIKFGTPLEWKHINNV